MLHSHHGWRWPVVPEVPDKNYQWHEHTRSRTIGWLTQVASWTFQHHAQSFQSHNAQLNEFDYYDAPTFAFDAFLHKHAICLQKLESICGAVM
jgi:hypothetical protein